MWRRKEGGIEGLMDRWRKEGGIEGVMDRWREEGRDKEEGMVCFYNICQKFEFLQNLPGYTNFYKYFTLKR